MYTHKYMQCICISTSNLLLSYQVLMHTSKLVTQIIGVLLLWPVSVWFILKDHYWRTPETTLHQSLDGYQRLSSCFLENAEDMQLPLCEGQGLVQLWVLDRPGNLSSLRTYRSAGKAGREAARSTCQRGSRTVKGRQGTAKATGRRRQTAMTIHDKNSKHRTERARRKAQLPMTRKLFNHF